MVICALPGEPTAATPLQDWLDLSFEAEAFEEMFVSEKPLTEIPEAREWKKQMAYGFEKHVLKDFADLCYLLKPEFAASELESFLASVYSVCSSSNSRFAHLPTIYMFAAVSGKLSKITLFTVQEDLPAACLRSFG